MAYYRRIRDLREDSDKTQTELANYLGTTAQHYGKYENGNAEIPFERAIMLAKYYKVSLDYLAGLTNNKHSSAATTLTKEQQEFINYAKDMSAADKSNTAEFLKKLNDMVK